MNEVKNIMIVGVGGQGALLASKTLGQVLLDSGFDVKVSEVHGMSQRGGSVVTYVRYGKKVYSPIVDKGQADFIVSFEMLITGAAEYPTNLQEKIQAANIKIDALDCLSLAEQAGTSKAVNIVLMGRLSKYMDFSVETWLQAIEKLVKPQFLEINKKAFLLGRGDN